MAATGFWFVYCGTGALMHGTRTHIATTSLRSGLKMMDHMYSLLLCSRLSNILSIQTLYWQKCSLLRPIFSFLPISFPSPCPNSTTGGITRAEHGQHIGLHRRPTLQYLADKHGKHLTSNGRSFHLFSDKPIIDLQRKGMLRGQNFCEFCSPFFA